MTTSSFLLKCLCIVLIAGSLLGARAGRRHGRGGGHGRRYKNRHNRTMMMGGNQGFGIMNGRSLGNGMQQVGFGGSVGPNGQVQVEILALFERDPTLLLHNRLRRHLAKGRVSGLPQYSNANFQGAQRMYKLTWDVLLEDKARYLVSFCQQMPQSNEYRNVYMTSSRASRKDLLLEATQNWWSQLQQGQQMDLSTPMQFNDGSMQGNIQSWKNVAASFLTRMGCAVNVCGRNGRSFSSMVVCLYANDVMTSPETLAFQPGPGCLHDSECTTYPGSTCKNAVCLNEDNELPQEIEEEFRGDILYEMNKYRRYLAHGKVANNGSAGFLPQASNMYKLEWARDLEERAQRTSLQCQNTLFDPTINIDLAHNVYEEEGVTRVDDFKQRGTILERTIHAWWGEIDRNVLPLQCAPGTEDQCYSQMQNFANMAYFRATEVGCGINHDCNNQSVVVCFFRKGAMDMKNHKLYPPGRPCLHDRECTEFGGSWCETHTGLCVDVAKGKARRFIQSIRNGLKQSIVNRQNSIRQRVIARLGEIANGPCHPTGNNYYKVQWNSKLEQRALAISSWCRRERRLRYQYIGENYFVSHDVDSHGDERKLLKKAFSKWLHESEANFLPNLDTSEKRDMCINYNNMLYGGYVNVACAVNHCNEDMHRFSLVVCLFQRSKSVVDSDLKVPFSQSCMDNSNTCNTYRNSQCEQNTGLCVYTKTGNGMFLNNNTFNNNGMFGVMNQNGQFPNYNNQMSGVGQFNNNNQMANGMASFPNNNNNNNANDFNGNDVPMLDPNGQPMINGNGINQNGQMGMMNNNGQWLNNNKQQQFDLNGQPIYDNMNGHRRNNKTKHGRGRNNKYGSGNNGYGGSANNGGNYNDTYTNDTNTDMDTNTTNTTNNDDQGSDTNVDTTTSK